MTTSRARRRFGIGFGIFGLAMALAPAAQAAPARSSGGRAPETVLVLRSYVELALGGNGVSSLVTFARTLGRPDLSPAVAAATPKAHVDNPAQSPMKP